MKYLKKEQKKITDDKNETSVIQSDSKNLKATYAPLIYHGRQLTPLFY